MNKLNRNEFSKLDDNQRLLWASNADISELYDVLETSENGKTKDQAEDAIEKFGINKVIYKKKI